MESCLKYLTGKKVLEEGTELSGIVESVLKFFELARAFSLDLRGLSMLEVTRALYAIACLQRVFGPLSVPVRASDSITNSQIRSTNKRHISLASHRGCFENIIIPATQNR